MKESIGEYLTTLIKGKDFLSLKEVEEMKENTLVALTVWKVKLLCVSRSIQN